MNKWTPGPWRHNPGSRQVLAASTSTGADGGPAYWWAVAEVTNLAVGKGDPRTAEADANTRLIAAAPELLEALEAMLDCYEGVYDMAVPTRHQSDEATRAEGLARGEADA